MLALIGSDIECFQRENCPFSWDMPATFNPCPPVFPLFSLWGLFVWSIRISLGNHRRNREKRHFRRLKSAANVTECDDSEIFEKFSDDTAYWLSSETGTIKKVKWRLIWVDFLPLFYVVALLFSFLFPFYFCNKTSVCQYLLWQPLKYSSKLGMILEINICTFVLLYFHTKKKKKLEEEFMQDDFKWFSINERANQMCENK